MGMKKLSFMLVLKNRGSIVCKPILTVMLAEDHYANLLRMSDKFEDSLIESYEEDLERYVPEVSSAIDKWIDEELPDYVDVYNQDELDCLSWYIRFIDNE